MHGIYCLLIAESMIEELIEEFRSRRLQFPCAAIVTPTDRKSLLSRRVMPFMLKLVREQASLCMEAAGRALADGNWLASPLLVSTHGLQVHSVSAF